MRRSPVAVLLAGLAGVTLISYLGNQNEWSPLTVFTANAAFLLLMATRRGITRPIMLALIAIQAIPVWGVAQVAIFGPLILLAALALRWRLNIVRLARSRLSQRDDAKIAEEARPHVDQLKEIGFQVVGSADASGPGYETIFTYLVSADRSSYAIATDKLQALASTYGDKVLVTTDRGSLPVPPFELRQVLNVTLPELYQAHKRALAVVRSQGAEPDHLDPNTLIPRILLYEQRSTKFVCSRPWWVWLQTILAAIRRAPPDSSLIDTSEKARRRVAAWTNA